MWGVSLKSFSPTCTLRTASHNWILGNSSTDQHLTAYIPNLISLPLFMMSTIYPIYLWSGLKTQDRFMLEYDHWLYRLGCNQCSWSDSYTRTPTTCLQYLRVSAKLCIYLTIPKVSCPPTQLPLNPIPQISLPHRPTWQGNVIKENSEWKQIVVYNKFG